VSNLPPAPTAEESWAIAKTFVDIANAAADDNLDQVEAMLRDYYGNDPLTAAFRLWYFAGCGPVLVSAAVRQLNKDRLTGTEFWAIRPDDTDPSALAALQAVGALLNGDEDAAHDALAAHANVAGLDGLNESVLHLIRMFASVQKEKMRRG
jgi:DNA-binding GntR family transcriptional regulator